MLDRRRAVCIGLLALTCAVPAAGADEPPRASDPRAVELAEQVLAAMGGREAWDGTRFVRWDFFGGRRHWWDRSTGDIRIESEDRIVLMNIHDLQGRVWDAGQELPAGPELDEALLLGHKWWVNDSYWMFMPYKLLDPGVTLKYSGERSMQDGRAADVVTLTFASGVGYTPQNRYEVMIAKDTGLVEEWAFFADAADSEPRFVLPWAGWQKFGGIMLATSHGQGKDWAIAVPQTLPRSVFESPQPVNP